MTEERIGARGMRAALAVPDGAAGGSHPGVVVLHEMFGLNDDMRRIAARFADNGYVAVAPDLWSTGNRLFCLTRGLMAGFSNAAERPILDQVEQARAWLAERPEVDADRMAVIGFCMGGGFALAFAAGGPAGVRAASVNYGAVPDDRSKLQGVCPVVASYGSLDRQFSKYAERLEEHLSALGVPHDVKLYDGVGHSFMSYDNVPGWLARLPSPMHVEYSEPEAEDAWRRILAFFDQYVKSQ